MTPWKTLATVETAEGPLQLRQRGAREFLILIGGRVLMTSSDRRSEQALATLACSALAALAPGGPTLAGGAHSTLAGGHPTLAGGGHPTRASEASATLASGTHVAGRPRVLVGGLGMAYTLRAALDELPAAAEVVVAELTCAIEDWCRGPLAPLTGAAIADPRVRVVIDDVARVIAAAPRGHYHAILLDLYEGPHAATQRPDDPFYGRAALARSHAALAPGGVLAVWSEEPDEPFARRLGAAGFDVETHRLGTTRSHVVYLARRRG